MDKKKKKKIASVEGKDLSGRFLKSFLNTSTKLFVNYFFTQNEKNRRSKIQINSAF